MQQVIRPTWAEINLDYLAHNIGQIRRQLAPDCQIIAVVKADAYGHGSIQIARAALAAGATWLAVSMLDEAVNLRQAGITAPILVMGYTPPEQGAVAARLGVSLAVYERRGAEGLVEVAKQTGKTLKVHLKVDTGMSRLGVMASEAVALASFLRDLPGCELEGVFTHLASADEPDPLPTLKQTQMFSDVLNSLQQVGICAPLVHVANSAAAVRFPRSRFNAVRLGLAMYGFYPYPGMQEQGISLIPIMSLKTTVTHAKWLPVGTPISYGGRFITQRPSYIVTLPIGYGDGLARSLGGKVSVYLRGQQVRLVGSICMDQCMADATAVPEAQAGDEVLVWGSDLSKNTAADFAGAMGTIVYEVTTMLSKRVPRLYLQSGQIVAVRTLLG
ncbi:MAG: alanine racemase [Firmicutes bacterium]|nr:alanine racemase [Bacillota bacterium]